MDLSDYEKRQIEEIGKTARMMEKLVIQHTEVRECAIERGKKIETMERLLKEARSLMIEVGESMDVPIQFRQHGWLKEVNELLSYRNQTQNE